MNTNEKGVILLSGGLDSLVCLDIASNYCSIETALTFNYGQKAFEDEKEASEKIVRHYNIKNHEIVNIPFLKELNSNALTDEKNSDFTNLENVWITNRNGLFLNIAACWAEKYNYQYIILGANEEESREFSDNTEEFICAANNFFKYSTSTKPIVFAPLLKKNKIQTINYAIEHDVPLKYIKSCYNKTLQGKKHCGNCMSCKLLYNAIKNSSKPELLGEIF